MERETGPGQEEAEFQAPEETEPVPPVSDQKPESGIKRAISNWREKEFQRKGFDPNKSHLAQEFMKFVEDGRKEVGAREDEPYILAWWRNKFGRLRGGGESKPEKDS